MKIIETKNFSISLSKAECEILFKAAEIFENMSNEINTLEETEEWEIDVVCKYNQTKHTFSSSRVSDFSVSLASFTGEIDLC